MLAKIMNCRMDPHTDTSCGLSIRPMTWRATEPISCCTPDIPSLAVCSTTKPGLAVLSDCMT